jgi:hypothetical protein
VQLDLGVRVGQGDLLVAAVGWQVPSVFPPRPLTAHSVLDCLTLTGT